MLEEVGSNFSDLFSLEDKTDHCSEYEVPCDSEREAYELVDVPTNSIQKEDIAN